MDPLNPPPSDSPSPAIVPAIRAARPVESYHDSFSGGRRWYAGRGWGIDWSVAWSLPLSGAGVLAVGLVESGLAPRWFGWLIGVWLVGLMVQAVVASFLWRWWLGRRDWFGNQTGRETGRGSGIATADANRAPTSKMQEEGKIVATGRPAIAPLDLTLTVGGTWLLPLPVVAVLPLWGCTLLTLVAISATAASFAGPQAFQSGWSWAVMPSLGASTIDQLPAAAAWLWCLQAVWQTLPIPGSLGRVGWSAVVHVVSGEASGSRIMRVLVNASAAAMLLSALVAMRSGQPGVSAPPSADPVGVDAAPAASSWTTAFAIAALSGWMFASSRGGDLSALQKRLNRTGPVAQAPLPLGRWVAAFRWRSWWTRCQDWRRDRQRRKRLLAAMIRERDEARDVQRAEEVLQKLHVEGMPSLSRQERELLQRVSEAVRRQRASTDA